MIEVRGTARYLGPEEEPQCFEVAYEDGSAERVTARIIRRRLVGTEAVATTVAFRGEPGDRVGPGEAYVFQTDTGTKEPVQELVEQLQTHGVEGLHVFRVTDHHWVFQF